jgi:hypothetical protein
VSVGWLLIATGESLGLMVARGEVPMAGDGQRVSTLYSVVGGGQG